MRLLLIGILKCTNRITGHFNLHVLGNTKLYSVLLKTCNRTVNPAVGNDLIANFEILDHLLELLLTAPLREDNYEVEDAENEQEGQSITKNVRLLGRLQKQRFNLSLIVCPARQPGAHRIGETR